MSDRQPQQGAQPPKPITPMTHQAPSLLPPWWSVLLTLVAVIGCVGALVMAFIGLGGNPAPNVPPQVVMRTAAPVKVEINPANQPTQLLITPASIQRPLDFVMAGPTLPPPDLTPTPLTIGVGVTVRVFDVGGEELNVRNRPGVIDTQVEFRAPENTLFTVIDGPVLGDGLTWWQVQIPDNPSRVGWAAADYLEVVPTEP